MGIQLPHNYNEVSFPAPFGAKSRRRASLTRSGIASIFPRSGLLELVVLCVNLINILLHIIQSLKSWSGEFRMSHRAHLFFIAYMPRPEGRRVLGVSATVCLASRGMCWQGQPLELLRFRWQCAAIASGVASAVWVVRLLSAGSLLP